MNKSEVKDRMLAFCAHSIGYKSVELIDPMLKLFIEALSEEVYQVRGEIDALEDRIVNTLAMYLVPDTSLYAKPAHSIVRLDTLSDEGLTVGADHVFNSFTKGEKREFYPIGNAEINKGGVRYIELNGKLLQYANYSKRFDLVAKRSLFETSEEKGIWIGIDLDPIQQRESKDLIIFLDILNAKNKKQLLDILFYAPWYIENNRLVLKRGGRFIDRKTETDIDLLQSFEPFYNIHQNIETHYNDQFIQVKNFFEQSLTKTSYPAHFDQVYAADYLSSMQQDQLYWIQIVLPDEFETELLDSINIALNCVPLINKNKRTISVEPHEITKIIKLPLERESYFLAIDSIKDSSGKVYYDVQYKDTEDQQYGTYTLRNGGYERYSSTDAKDYLEGLGEFLLVESHRMASGASTDENILKIYSVLQDMINYIQAMTLATKQKMEHQVYVVLDQYVPDEIYYIDYWTTSGEKANEVDSTSIVTPGYNNTLAISGINLQTDFILGNSEPNSVEKRQEQKNALNQVNVIVNDLDIYAFCQFTFRHVIENVQVKSGVEFTEEQGFNRTIDVYLTPNKNLSNFLTQRDSSWFKNQLEKVSPEHFDYRIFLAS